MRFLIACLLALCPLAAQTSDEKDVLATVEKVFVGMRTNDSAGILAAMTADARLFGVRANGDAYAIPAEQWATRLVGMKSKFEEHFTGQPKVAIHGTIANVWGDYEFLRDGKFTHCGVDSFNLVKVTAGWKVAAIFDTEETTGCPAAK